MEITLIGKVIAGLSYREGWHYNIGGTGSHKYLQIGYEIPGEVNPRMHHGRKWLLSDYMTEGEIVQTALMATLVCEEHEARENFKYKGLAVFHPHHDIDALLEIADAVETRP
jgi:hypothetical protein